jgi:hypothetical protein
VRYDWAVAARFPASQPQLPLPPRSKITHEGTTCAVTPDGRTYCERGAMRFVIEPTKTWLSGPWMDLSWMEHMTEGTEEGVDSSDAIRRVLADIMSLIGTMWTRRCVDAGKLGPARE